MDSYCWTCRRRRVKCDGLRPHCEKCRAGRFECLGYGKLITWVRGIASRGHMKDSTFEDPVPPPLTNHVRKKKGTRYVNYIVEPSGGLLAIRRHDNLPLGKEWASATPLLGIPRALTDPIFQDLCSETRGLVHYYDSCVCSDVMMLDGAQNPYRALISLVGTSKAVFNAMMAVASCHDTHTRTGYPVFLDLAGPTFDRPTFDMITRSITFKQRALAYLADTVSNPPGEIKIYVLATILLLMLLELYEGGTGPWAAHLEGAKQLIEAERGSSSINTPPMIKNILEELFIFDAVGSTLVQPSFSAPPSSTQLTLDIRDDSSFVSGLGCPMQILAIIHSVNFQWRTLANHGTPNALTPYDTPVRFLSTALEGLARFDAEAWTDQIMATFLTQCAIPREHVFGISLIWRLSAEVYTSHVLYQLTGQASSTSQLHQLVAAINCLASVHTVTRFLLWPIFIAGAESTLLEHRQCALAMLDQIWNISRIASAKSASDVLRDLWTRETSKELDSSPQEPESGSWMVHLFSLGTSWLFV